MKRDVAFWDASALVPLCVEEANTRLARQYLRRYPPVVWWASSVEVRSAICRLKRASAITQNEYQGAQSRLERLRLGWREVLPGDDLREIAERLLDGYPLRAGDSLQLAAAQVWCAQRPARRVFLSADQRLSAAATALGFRTIELISAQA